MQGYHETIRQPTAKRMLHAQVQCEPLHFLASPPRKTVYCLFLEKSTISHLFSSTYDTRQKPRVSGSFYSFLNLVDDLCGNLGITQPPFVRLDQNLCRVGGLLLRRN